MRLAAILLASPLAIACCAALAQGVVFGGPTQADLDALAAKIGGPVVRSTTVPTSGPGGNQCQHTIVPSNLVTSGGMAGTSGTCAMIVMCGTSSTVTVETMNVGNGC